MKKELIVITGASSGIGKATAKLFSSKGYPLLLLARRLEILEEMNLPNSISKKVDILDVDQFKKAVKEAEEKFGPVNCLINNAGVMLLGEVSSQDPKEWMQMINTNILGMLNGIHIVLKDMCQRENGTIINVSSVAGRKTFPSHSVYCATKFAVHGLTENIREEVANKNVRAITIAPGAVETELLSHTTSNEIKQDYDKWKKDIGGALMATDIANAIAFAYEQPQNICIREVVIAATRQGP
jgi:NADP-dependent 3-hydroxy acid dehydrogenase YdfG